MDMPPYRKDEIQRLLGPLQTLSIDLVIFLLLELPKIGAAMDSLHYLSEPAYKKKYTANIYGYNSKRNAMT